MYRWSNGLKMKIEKQKQTMDVYSTFIACFVQNVVQNGRSSYLFTQYEK